MPHRVPQFPTQSKAINPGVYHRTLPITNPSASRIGTPMRGSELDNIRRTRIEDSGCPIKLLCNRGLSMACWRDECRTHRNSLGCIRTMLAWEEVQMQECPPISSWLTCSRNRVSSEEKWGNFSVQGCSLGRWPLQSRRPQPSELN